MTRKIVILLMLLPLSGCAKYPHLAAPSAARKQLIFELTVDSKINDTYYYFIAIDTDEDPSDGPRPVVSGPFWGNGWGTGSFTYHIEYHGNFCRLYREYLDPTTYEPKPEWPPSYIGPPFEFRISPDRKTITIAIDYENLKTPTGTTPTSLDINFIFTSELITDPNIIKIKPYDGLGATGNEYITISTITNMVKSGEDPTGDVSIADFEGAKDLDLKAWKVELKL